MTKKFALTLAAVVFLGGCSGKKGGSSEVEKNKTDKKDYAYDFEITEKGLELRQKDGGQVQELEIDSNWLRQAKIDNKPVTDLIVMDDFDFDGSDDLAVQMFMGESEGTYQYFRYNSDNGLFESWDTMNSFYLLASTDPQNKTLSFTSKNGENGFYTTVYKWIDELLMPVSATIRYEDGGELLQAYFEYDDEGNEINVKRERILCDENGVPTGEREEVNIESEEEN